MMARAGQTIGDLRHLDADREDPHDQIDDVARVATDNAVTSCELQILVDQAAERVASSDAVVAVRGPRRGSCRRWPR
jgi:hypothetical protein